MIKGIHIQNYESHRDTFLDLSPGLNVFVGLSDAGKSAVFRALNWVVSNRPLGDAMVPLFGKPGVTSVMIETSDGHTVIKRKGAGPSEYEVDGKRLTGFGTEVPKDVREAMGFDEVNFQDQISLPFLMFDPPSERARALNRVAGLTEIDACMSAAETDLRKVRVKISSGEDRVLVLREQLDRYDDVERREELVEVAEMAQAAVQKMGWRREELSKVVRRLTEIDKEIEKQRKVLGSEKTIEQARLTLERINYLTTKVASIRLVLNELDLNAAQIQKWVKACEELSHQLPDLCPTCGNPLSPTHPPLDGPHSRRRSSAVTSR